MAFIGTNIVYVPLATVSSSERKLESALGRGTASPYILYASTKFPYVPLDPSLSPKYKSVHWSVTSGEPLTNRMYLRWYKNSVHTLGSYSKS